MVAYQRLQKSRMAENRANRACSPDCFKHIDETADEAGGAAEAQPAGE
jgi:hypothetical protein